MYSMQGVRQSRRVAPFYIVAHCAMELKRKELPLPHKAHICPAQYMWEKDKAERAVIRDSC